MKRILIALLTLVLTAGGLLAAAPAHAVGDGAPVIQSPTPGYIAQVGEEITFVVDFANAPAASYALKVIAPDTTTVHEVAWDSAADGDSTSFDYAPTFGAGGYRFVVANSSGSEHTAVDFTVEAPAPPPPPPPVVKRPSAPRAVHTAVASKKATLHWAAPASTGGAAITGYQVLKGKTVRNLRASARSSLFTGLKNKHVYSFSVRARNRAGWSAWAKASAKPHKPKKVKKKKHHKAPKPPKARTFANCDAMHQVYPHGVGRPGAVDNGGVTDFYVSAAIYNANTKSDRDKDGVACESD